MRVAGIDVGAGTAKTVILEDEEIVSWKVMPVQGNVAQAAEQVTHTALEKAGISLEALDCIVSTGYGRDAIPFAHRAISEIICHAIGVHFLIPSARIIIDIGAQDSKVMRVNQDGKVIDFAMNDKCAAGTGRFLEVMAQVLGVSLEEMGSLSMTSKNLCNISSTCTVFAETEVVSLRAEGKHIEDLIAGIHRAIALRVVTMGSHMKFNHGTAFTGGVAKNVGVKNALEKTSGVEIIVPAEPQITGALGAALAAREACKKQSGSAMEDM
jgi:predicted CoA-substrate-specific enzyme activase